MEKEFLDALMPHFNMPCQTRDGRRSVLNEYELNHRERKLEIVVKIGGAQWPERGRYAAFDKTTIFKAKNSKTFIYILKHFKMNRISIQNLYFTILLIKQAKILENVAKNA